ncbi:MAG: glycosyltransferase [Smithella sp.]|jgi:glycosyltransferase involved in cell wall biosynthesis
MNYSVVICTFNRAESLRRMLKSLQEVVIPDHLSCEFIVVDNNSNDDTRLVVEEIGKHFESKMKYVFEDKQGIAHARNRGIKEARGEIIAFTDDDVIVDKYWIQNIDKAFKDHDDAACVGGKILPIWEISKPKWLKPDFYGYLALLDYGDSVVYMDTPTIWSANLAVKSEMYKKHGHFDTNLGRIPKKLYGGEETEFLRRLLTAGEKILYHPLLIVHHYIPAERISKRYMRKWEFDNGELEGILMEDAKYSDIMIYQSRTTRIMLLKQVIESLLKMGCFTKNRFNHELRICHISGFLSGRMKRMFIKS